MKKNIFFNCFEKITLTSFCLFFLVIFGNLFASQVAQASQSSNKQAIEELYSHRKKSHRSNNKQFTLIAQKNSNSPNINELIQRLLEDELEVRTSAFNELKKLEINISVPALSVALENGDWKVRTISAYTLGQLASDRKDTVPKVTFLRPLIKAAQDEHPYVRAAVAEALGNVGTQSAVSELIRLLDQDPDDTVRYTAASVLMNPGLEAQNSLPVLLEALREDKNWFVRNKSAAAFSSISVATKDINVLRSIRVPSNDMDAEQVFARNAINNAFIQMGVGITPELLENSALVSSRNPLLFLARMGTDTIPALINVLNEGNVHERLVATNALGFLKAEEAVPHLMRELHEETNPSEPAQYLMKSITAQSLGMIYNEAAEDALIEALHLPADRSLGHIALSLLENRSIKAQPALERALQSSDEETRAWLIWALWWAGGSEAVDIITQGLVESPEEVFYLLGDYFSRSFQDESIKRKISVVLTQPAYISILVEALQADDEFVRAISAEILSKAQSEDIQIPELQRAISQLTENLQSENVYTRYIAADSLGSLKIREAIPALILMLQDDDSYARYLAAESLGGMYAPAAIPALTSTLRDKNCTVRGSAAYALWLQSSYGINNINDKDIVSRLSNTYEQNCHSNIRWRRQHKKRTEQILDALASTESGIDYLEKRILSESNISHSGDFFSLLDLNLDAVMALTPKSPSVVIEAITKHIENNGSAGAGEHYIYNILRGLNQENLSPYNKFFLIDDFYFFSPKEIDFIKSLEQIDRFLSMEEREMISNRLVSTLGNPNKDFHDRFSGIKLLGVLKSEVAIPFLISNLNDQDWRIQLAASEALAAIGPSAIPSLLEILRTSSTEDFESVAIHTILKENMQVQLLKRNAIYALSKIKSIERNNIVDELINELEGIKRYKSENLHIRWIAEAALQNFGQEDQVFLDKYGLANPRTHVCLDNSKYAFGLGRFAVIVLHDFNVYTGDCLYTAYQESGGGWGDIYATLKSWLDDTYENHR